MPCADAECTWARLSDDVVERVPVLADAATIPAFALLERRCSYAAGVRLRKLMVLRRSPFLIPGAWICGQPDLVTLNLCDRSIGAKDIQCLSDACVSGALTQIKTLYLASNHMGDAGLHTLATAFSSGALPQLAQLHLCANQISSAGLSALCSAALCSLQLLEVVSLAGNRIADAGAVSLVTACSNGAMPRLSHLRLERLEVGDNPIGDAGAAAMASAIRHDHFVRLSHLHVPRPIGEHSHLKKACSAKGIELRST
jgi:hypothetical protein